MFDQQQIALLRTALDPDAVRTLEHGGSKGSQYIETHFVIDSLNRIIGEGRWSLDVLEHRPIVPLGDKSGGGVKVSWYAKVKLTVTDEHGGAASYTDSTVSTAFGREPGDVHDQASKSCISGALKRCARNLGRPFGLELYGRLPPVEQPQGQPLAVEAKAPAPAKVTPPRAPASLGRDDKPQWMAARARIVAHCATVDVAGGMVGLVLEAAGGGQDPALRTGAQLEGFATKWETLDTVAAAAKCGAWIKLYRGGKA